MPSARLRFLLWAHTPLRMKAAKRAERVVEVPYPADQLSIAVDASEIFNVCEQPPRVHVSNITGMPAALQSASWRRRSADSDGKLPGRSSESWI